MRKVKETDPLSAGFKMLARRPYSVAEFRRALERKCGATAAVHEAVNHLRQLGYLDDKKFAEQTAYSLAQNRAFGPHRVRRELKAKLVNYKFIDSAVAAAYQDSDPRQLLEKALDRKVRSLKLPVTPQKLASLCQSLLRRGFSTGDILKAVRARAELKPVTEFVSESDLENERGRLE